MFSFSELRTAFIKTRDNRQQQESYFELLDWAEKAYKEIVEAQSKSYSANREKFIERVLTD